MVTEPLHVYVETTYINTTGNTPAIGKAIIILYVVPIYITCIYSTLIGFTLIFIVYKEARM